MINKCDDFFIEAYKNYLTNKEFPCVAARAAISRQQISYMVAEHMACPKDDQGILNFLYDFVDKYRSSGDLFHSATIIFKGPEAIDENIFEVMLWQRLQSLANLDAQQYPHDERVNQNPHSPDFSFSIKQEAFFIIGLHPANSRKARRFEYPVLVFNPHAQFEHLRQNGGYEKMKNIVRKRDVAYSGSVNPMLKDFGKSSEVYQYSGRVYDEHWRCPLNFTHESIGDHSTT